MKQTYMCMRPLLLILGCLVVIWVIALRFISSGVQGVKPEDLKKLIESKADIVMLITSPKRPTIWGISLQQLTFPTYAHQVPINLPRHKPLILYCACSHEEDSTDMAEKLREFGFDNIKVLEGGWLRGQSWAIPLRNSRWTKGSKEMRGKEGMLA